jgi:MFS family permease
MLEPAETELSKKTNSKILSILMFIIVFVSMGQSVYWQTMPILGRELGFSEVQINSLISISAAMFIIFTPFWGRLSDRIGRKSVLIMGLSGYVISSLIFCVLVTFGLLNIFSGWVLLGSLLLARIINSALGAASRPATGAYVADITSNEDRSSGMGKFGAANNIGTIAGPVLVGSAIGLNIFQLDIENIGLISPLLIMSFIMVLAIVFALTSLPNKKTKISLDKPSIRPVLNKQLKILIAIGIIIFTAFAIVQSVVAYYLQDRFLLDLNQTARSTALSLGGMALMSILVQLTVVQKYKGPPLNLITLSIPFFLLSAFVVIFSSNFITFIIGMGLMGLAMGLASPGYTAAASLNANSENQGAAVGLAMIAPGVGFALGPLLSGFLYQEDIILPFVTIIPLSLIALFLILFLKRKTL